MRLKGGVIFEMVDNRFGIGYYKDQRPEFTEKGKVFLHTFKDRKCTEPEMVDGKPHTTLKSWHLLTIIGYVD